MSDRGNPLTVDQFANFSAAVLKALPRDIDSVTAQGWAENSVSLRDALRSTLCPPEQEVTERSPVQTFLRPWATVSVGGKSSGELLKEMESRTVLLNPEAVDILKKRMSMLLTPKKKTITLARERVRDLGFEKEPTTVDLWYRIAHFGHELCTVQIAAHLRLDVEQSLSDLYEVPIKKALNDNPNVYECLGIRRIGKIADEGRPGAFLGRRVRSNHRWGLAQEVVFVLNK